MTTAHVVAPDAVDDPARPSGGNTYDRRICTGLTELGWSVRLHTVPGPWPRPDAQALAALSACLAGVPDGSTVLFDGLVASCAPDVVAPAADRLPAPSMLILQVDGRIRDFGQFAAVDFHIGWGSLRSGFRRVAVRNGGCGSR